MSDNPDRQREHWRELAELLGLDPDAPQADAPQAAEKPSPAPEPVRAQPEVRETAHVEVEPRPRGPAAPAIEDNFEDAVDSPQSLPPGQFEEIESARERESPTVVQEAAPWAAPTRDEERSRQGGRRGRGRRGRSERQQDFSPGPGDREAGAEAEKDQLTEEEEDQQDADLPGRRGPGTGPEPPEEEIVDDAEAPAPVDADDEIDEEDTLSDWNVPSWNELISSLYRPER
jgi:hypothetical protein